MRTKPPVPELLAAARARGLIDESTLQQALNATSDPEAPRGAWGPEIEFLLRAGAIEPSQILNLSRELGESDATRVSGGTPSSPTPGVHTPTPDIEALRPLSEVTDDPAIQNWDKYKIGDRIGRGGMGAVYRARDLQLDRDVAIKFLHRSDPDVVRRFWREARAQAQADHANICQVYEVGEHAGHIFIAMQLVQGQSLMEAGLFMTLDEKVKVMISVAQAVHAAHRKQLIHRDLKPANVIVEQTAQGWRPFVLDFGIARDLRNDGVTETGTVMGTLAYISPEQARGAVAELDKRSDIYGLGATMYTLLGGTPPFAQSDGADTIWRIAHEDIRPLRQREPSVPRELDTIVMKCLEKDPDRRYQTAQQVADDLGRFLAGDPIVARPPTLAYRARKLIRRNSRLAAVGALAVVALSVTGAVAVKTRFDAVRQASLAHRLNQEVREMETAARLSALLPTHDRSAEVDALDQRLSRIRTETESLGSYARGPVSYALGHGHLLLDDFALAVRHLQTAWELGYKEPSDAYALGRAYGGLYQLGLEELRQVEDPQTRERQQARIERDLRRKATQYLHAAEHLETDAPSYVEGLIAFYEGRYEDALSLASAAYDQVEWMYEARRLVGDIHLAVANELQMRGDFDGSQRAMSLAGEAYDQAAVIGRSDTGVFAGACARWTLEMERRIRLGQPADRAFNSAVDACTTALSVNPNHVESLNRLSKAHWKWADNLVERGRDPGAHLDTAIRLAEHAAKTRSQSLLAHYNRGCALLVTGVHDLNWGRDPRTALDRAVTSFRHALEINPVFVPAHDDLGYALERKAKYELEHGLDPTASIDEAVDSYRSALEISPTFPNSHNNLGIALLRRGQLQAKRGRDPETALKEAIASFDAAIANNPNYPQAHINKGYVYRTWADHEVRRDRDPTHLVTLGRDSFAAGTAINPNLSWSYPERARLELAAARWAVRHELPADPFLAAAREAIDTAASLNPSSVSTWLAAASTALEEARWHRKKGIAADSTIERGESAVSRAFGLQPDSADAELLLGQLMMERAISAESALRSEELRALADQHFNRVRALDPMLADLEVPPS